MSHRFPLGDPVEHNDANKYKYHLLGRNLGNGSHEFLSCVQPMNDDTKTRLQVNNRSEDVRTLCLHVIH